MKPRVREFVMNLGSLIHFVGGEDLSGFKEDDPYVSRVVLLGEWPGGMKPLAWHRPT